LTLLGLVGIAYCIVFGILFRNSPGEHPRANAAERALIGEDTWARHVDKTFDKTSVGNRFVLHFVARSRDMRYFTLQQFLDAGSDVAFVALIGAYFLQARQFDISKTGWLASLPLWGGALGGIAGGWLNDWLIRRTGSRRWSRSGVGFVGKLIGFALLPLVVRQSSGEAAAWLLMGAKFFSDWSQPTTWGMCTDLGGRFSATIFSVINTAGTIGGIVMPLIFGGVLDWYTTEAVVDGTRVMRTDWNPLFLLLAAMYLGSGVCWLMIDCTKSLDSSAESSGTVRSQAEPGNENRC
jgi:MFS family permease